MQLRWSHVPVAWHQPTIGPRCDGMSGRRRPDGTPGRRSLSRNVLFQCVMCERIVGPSGARRHATTETSSSSLSYLNILCTYQYSVSQNCKKNNLDDMSLVPKGYLYCYRLHVDASYRIPKNAIFPFDFPPTGYICQTVLHTLSRMILDNALEDETHASLILRIFIN